MKLFFSKNKPVGNTRRTPKKTKPVKKPMRWIKPMFQSLAVSTAIVICGFGVWKLNEKLSVSYWDIEAEAHIKPQIEKYLAAQKDLDFWHTRASVLQAGLEQQIPDIQYLQISRILPDGLLVKAVARQPMALWKHDATQQVMLIDEKGVAYRNLQRGETLDLPVLRLSQEALSESVNMLLALQKMDAEKWMRLSEVIVADNGWRLNFARGEQWKIDSNHLQQDLAQIINILAMPRWANGSWRLDTRISERWFIRPAKQEVI